MLNRYKRKIFSPCSLDQLPLRLVRWSFIHALFMVSAAATAWIVYGPGVLFFLGTASFLLLIFFSRPHWTRGGAFGPANAVTAVRLGGVLVLPFFFSVAAPHFIAVTGFLLLLTDGLDGWLARRFDQASEFGEYLDKETDAFFLLVLCTIAVGSQRLGPWVLISGLLRYFFVLVLHFVRRDFLKEGKSSRAQFIYVLMMVALLSSFLPLPGIYRPVVAIATLALIGSFVRDFCLGFSRN